MLTLPGQLKPGDNPGLVEIHVSGKPVAWARAGSHVINGKPVHFTPTNYRRWYQDARMMARQAMEGRKILTGCVQVQVFISIVPPKSWPAWKLEAALDHRIEPSGTPDLSNLVKAAEDACSGVVFLDDAQIVCGRQNEIYSEEPWVHIRVIPRNTSPATIKRRSDLKQQGAGK